MVHEFPACCCLLAKGGSLIFVQDFKGGPLIIKPYSSGGPRKNKQVKILFLQPPTPHTLRLVPNLLMNWCCEQMNW
jgi:hypothetical protein